LGEFLDERFLGKLCISGEDKRLTSLVLKAGFDTYHQDDAVVRSTFPPDVKTFFNQRLRWARNTYRSDLRALWERWVWRRPYLAFMLVDRLVSPYALLIGLTYLIHALAAGQWPIALGLSGWWIASRAVKLAPHLRREPRDLLILPAFVALTFALAALKVYALATVHHHRWLTRQVEVVNGEVVRGGGRARDRTTLPVRAAGVALVLAFAVTVTGSFVMVGGLSRAP
jgi:hyaluronan synthase